MEKLDKIMLLRVMQTFYDRVKAAGEKRGLNVSQLVRMILTDWLKENEFDDA